MKHAAALLAFFIFVSVSGQSGFQFETNRNKVVIPFKLINNLIFIPISVNGIELNFLLDTGVEETILLSLDEREAVSFFNVQKIKLRGLGSDEAVEGLKSTNNVMSINGLVDRNHDLYIVLDQSFNFSSHVGIPVNGIIGYHFFKNQFVEVNYDRKKVIIYKDIPKNRKKISQNFTSIPITIEKNKPYAVASVTINGQPHPAKLLIDSGNSDALWLFENKSAGIGLPAVNFEDYLGKGFSGDINGHRTRIPKFQIAQFDFYNPIIAFPDSASTKNVTMLTGRVGSVGGEILKRFAVILDYQNQMMFLKKGNNYGARFGYNMSGIELQNEGVQWVTETVPLETVMEDNTFGSDGEKVKKFKYKFSLKPVYTVSNIRKNSPAELAGLAKGDIVVSINYVIGYKYSLEEINELLKSDDGKWLNLEVERNGKSLRFKFQLKDML